MNNALYITRVVVVWIRENISVLSSFLFVSKIYLNDSEMVHRTLMDFGNSYSLDPWSDSSQDLDDSSRAGHGSSQAYDSSHAGHGSTFSLMHDGFMDWENVVTPIQSPIPAVRYRRVKRSECGLRYFRGFGAYIILVSRETNIGTQLKSLEL